MQHRGEIIKAAVYKSGVPITTLAKQMGKSRRWMYLMFENNTVSLDVVLQIGKIIHHDFSEDIKELHLAYTTKNTLETSNENETQDAAYWQSKYFKLLEEYNELLKVRLSMLN